MRTTARRLLVPLVAGLWQTLACLGGLWVDVHGLTPNQAGTTAPRHPERLCPEVPPTPTERTLWAQLDHTV
ncbi:DUF6059 family protein [Kitasatospora sp. NPDC059648]|uniref:DUF6059 family protein n=1 Tax=Kitasatospora sp. NPDC059648 TaxID=3346894 RepID=UPI0036BC1456